MRAKLQALYEKATAIQNDLLHKFTTYLYQTYDAIVIEDLDIKSMQMSKKGEKSTSVSIWEIPFSNGIQGEKI